jgi:glycosyltransferase involved in cell wall biosynthesis
VRILVISNFYPPAHFGGYELECAGVVDHLRADHDVLVLTSRHEARSTPPEPNVRRVLPFDRARKVDSLRAPLSALAAARQVRSVLRAFDPELVFVWNGTRIPQATIRIASTSGRPVAFRVCEHWFGRLYRSDLFMRHLFPGDAGLRRAWARVQRLVNRHPLLRLDVSAAAPASISWVTDSLRRATPRPTAVEPLLERTIHWGVEQPGRPSRTPAAEPLFAYVGQVTPQKGPDIALRALPALERRAGIRAGLVLIGREDRRYGRELRQAARRLGVERRVRFAGPLDREAVRAELASVHAVVVPSRWQEPAGLVPVESAALGIPVVAARSGGIPELLQESEHALFFDIDDVEACAAAMSEIILNRDQAAARAERARRHVARLSVPAYHAATDAFIADTLRAYSEMARSTSPAMASTE